jgi:hypothetical protein
MQPVRGVGAAAATFGLFLLSCQHAEVVASRSTASAFIPAPQRSSQQHFALLNQNGISRGATQCWAKRSSDRKRKMMGGPLGPAPTETPPLQPEGVNADEPMTQDGEGSMGRVSGRAGAGTGFGAVPVSDARTCYIVTTESFFHGDGHLHAYVRHTKWSELVLMGESLLLS